MKPEHERAREIGERLGEMDERAKPLETLESLKDFIVYLGGQRKLEHEAMQLALQGLADALKRMLAVFPPEFDEKWAESSGEKIQVQAWNQARAALDAAKLFLEAK